MKRTCWAAIAFVCLGLQNQARAADTDVDPLQLEFHRLGVRRFIFQNNLVLGELIPAETVSLQTMHPAFAPGADNSPVHHPEASYSQTNGMLAMEPSPTGTTLYVSGVNPYATCELNIQEVDPVGGSLEVGIDLATLGLRQRIQLIARYPDLTNAVLLRFVKEGQVAREDVLASGPAPRPPYILQLQLAGIHAGAFFTRNGSTEYLGHTAPQRHFKGLLDLRERETASASTFNIYTKGSSRSRLLLNGARSMLSPGIGQADIRMITFEDGAPFWEDHRLWFTFSARGVNIEGSAQGVMSLNPSIFDFRFEGFILFDHGDGLLRNDYASHVFYDRNASEWRAWVCDFGGSAGQEGRGQTGLIVARSKHDPRRGISVMGARVLPGFDRKQEDPCGFYDAEAGKWRMVLSTFVSNSIRASMFEADAWDGPWHSIAGPVEKDSTGTLIQKIGSRRYVFSGSSEGPMYVYTYPELKLLGPMKLSLQAHWPKGAGRGWPNVFPLPAGFPYRYVALMMDRPNFPGVKGPNWSYGALHWFGAYTSDIVSHPYEFEPIPESR